MDFQANGQPFETPPDAADQTYAQTPVGIGEGFAANLFSSSRAVLEGAQTSPVIKPGFAAQAGEAIQNSSIGEGALPPVGFEQGPQLNPQEASKFLPESAKPFTQPVRQNVARFIGDRQRADMERDSVLSRFDAQHSWPVNLGVSLAAGMLDPTNIAAGFLPGVGEGAIAAGLGRIGLEGVGARLAARAISGGATNAAASAPQEILEAQQDPDMTLRDAFRSMATNAAVGAIMHAGIGVGREFGILRPDELMLSGAQPPQEGAAAAVQPQNATEQGLPPQAVAAAQQVAQADPLTRADAMKAAVSQIVDGRPVDVAPVFDALAAKNAETELTGWFGQQQRIDAETDQALRVAGANPAAADRIQAQLEDLRTQHAGFLSDIAAGQGRLGDQTDTATRDRLAAIETEMRQPGLPAERRDALESERSMLTQGAATTPEQDALEAARTQAELAGLNAGRQRLESKIRGAQRRLDQARATNEAQNATASRSFAIQAARVESRERVVQALAERTIRRYAAHVGAAVGPDELRSMGARAIREGKPAIGAILEDLRTRAKGAAPATFEDPAALAAESGAQFRAQAQDGLRDAAARQAELYKSGFAPGFSAHELAELQDAVYGPQEGAGEPPLPEPVEAEGDGSTAAGEAPGQPAAASPLDRDLTDAQAALARAGAELHPDDAAEIEAANAALERSTRLADAYAQAGECLSEGLL